MIQLLKKRKFMILIVAICLIALGAGYVIAAENMDDDTIISGVYIGDIDVSGMTAEEAEAVVNEYVDELSSGTVSLMVGENSVDVPVSSLGFEVKMQDVYEEAAGLCKKGNIVKRYKDKKHLEKEGMYYDLTYSFDEEAVRQVIEEKCKTFDQMAVDATIKRSGGGFEITDGAVGYALDVDASVKLAMDFLNNEWNTENTVVALSVVETQPRGTREELSKVQDLLATATTSYSTSGSNRCGNVERGASLIDGTILYPGEEFSCYGTVSPITVENGYFMAASYAEGQVVESAGGGICQVSTTLYNAVLKAELEVTQRSNHSMIVSYVDPAKDSAIAGTYKDLKFVNNSEAPIYIEGITSGKKITFNIYGMETRSSNRKVEFISETIEETEPVIEIKVDESAQFGSVSKVSAHKGIVAKLWKVVTENGEEVSRTEVNKSTYAMSPERYTIGLANGTPEAIAELNAAIATQDINAVNAVIGKYVTVPTDAVPVVDGDLAAEGNVAGDPSQQPAQPSTPQQPTQPTQPSQSQAPATATPQPSASQQPVASDVPVTDVPDSEEGVVE